MKRFLLFTFLLAVFFGGYWCGRQPGSPDIFGWAGARVQQFKDAGGMEAVGQALDSARREVTGWFSSDSAAPAAPAEEPTAEARRPSVVDELSARGREELANRLAAR